MSNMLKGEASFEANGRKWELVLDFYAFASAQQALGLGTLDALMKRLSPEIDVASGAVVREPDILALGALLRAGLEDKHPELSARDAVNLLSAGEAVGEALGRAMQGAFPGAGDQGASAEGNAPGTGTKPKPSGRGRG